MRYRISYEDYNKWLSSMQSRRVWSTDDSPLDCYDVIVEFLDEDETDES